MARQMKDSGVEWIGQIPEEWKLSKIGAIYEERNEKVSDTDFQPLSVTKQGVIPQLESAAKSNDSDNRKLIRKNDFVINSRSDRRGSCGISEYDGSCSLINTVLKPRRNMCNAYYGFVFRSECFADEFYRWGNGIVDDLWSTKWSNMKRIYIPAPPLKEQEKIASYLDRKCAEIDAIIAKQQQIIEKLKEYKLSVITEAVTKGLDPNVPMKDSEVEWIGKIPEHWVTGKIKNFCNLKTGSTPSTSNTEWFDGTIRWFTPGDFVETFILKDSARTLSQKAKDDMVAVIVPPNTVMIVGIGATAGKIGYTMVECSCNQQITAINTNKIMPKYLMYWMIANTKFLRDTAMFTTLPILNNQTIGNYLVMFPDDRNEEKEVVDYLDGKCDKIEILIEAKKHEIDRLHRYKKSIIYEIVTGKMEV